MRQHRWFFALAAGFFLTACGMQTQPTPPPVVDGSSLLSTLEGAGVRLREVEREIIPIEGTIARVYSVNGEVIFLYEFDDKQDQEMFSELVASSSRANVSLFSEDAGYWSAGKLLVVYEGKDGGTVLLLDGLLGDALVAPRSSFDEPFPPAVVAAIYLVADDMGVDPSTVEVVEVDPVIWPDSCLLYPDLDEGCLEVETPGWRVLLEIYNETIEVHTDEFGEAVRWR